MCIGFWEDFHIVIFVFILSKLDEHEAKSEKTDLLGDLKNSVSLFSYKKVLFFLCAFLFVLVEQSFQTWTPTFYKEILKVPTSMSIQAGAFWRELLHWEGFYRVFL
jgi:fucose permease